MFGTCNSVKFSTVENVSSKTIEDLYQVILQNK